MILPSCSTDEADESTDHCSNHGSDGLICWWHWWHWWADCTDGADFLSIMHNRFWWHSHASCTLMLFILISCHFNSFHLISFQLISYQSSHPCNLMLMQLQLPMSSPWHSHWQIWVSLMPISWKTNDVSCFVDHSSLISHIFFPRNNLQIELIGPLAAPMLIPPQPMCTNHCEPINCIVLDVYHAIPWNIS